ncbi:MAG: LacI family DNA-binding transcriptional regulator [Paludibacter sp.]
MQNIADKLGISRATVSLVLSGKAKTGRISDEMQSKVKKLAKELNYHPNEIARSLSTGVTKSIGVIVTDISNEFFGKMVFHIQERAKHYGYSVITANTNENLNDFDEAVTVLINRQVDGIILVPVEGGNEIVKRIISRKIPLVQIDRFYPDLNSNYIVIDNYNISKQAIELLINEGKRRIAVICYDINLSALTERKQGYIDAMKQRGLFDVELIKNIGYDNQEKEIEQAISDIKNSSDKVDAIFFCSRKVFLTGVKYMVKLSIKIPEDMSVICFDKIDAFSFANIPVIYIEQPIQQMSEKAIDLLIEQLQGNNQIEQLVLDSDIKYTI